jgi:uncharacterized OB-fold protein
MRKDAYPYAFGVIAIDGGDGARVCGNLVGTAIEELRIGQRMRAVFTLGERALPSFERE